MDKPKKLYAVAIAAIPHQGNPKVLSIICNPISMEEAHRDTFKLAKYDPDPTRVDEDLKGLSFTRNVDMTDPKAVADCVIETVHTIDEVIKRQEKNCEAAGAAYRKVALRVGQDSRHPIVYDSENPSVGEQDPRSRDNIYLALFNQHYHPLRRRLFSGVTRPGGVYLPSLEELRREIPKQEMLIAKLLDPPRKYQSAQEITAQDRKEIEDYLGKQNALGRHIDSSIRWYTWNKQELTKLEQENEIYQADALERRRILKSETDLNALINAYETLARSLEKCSLTWGNYDPGKNRDEMVLHWEKAALDDDDLKDTEKEDLRSKMDIELTGLWQDWHGGDDVKRNQAHNRIIELARKEGGEAAAVVNKMTGAFGYNPAPPAFKKDGNNNKPEDRERAKKLQKRYPHFCFLEWDPAFKAAFYEAYHESFRGRYTRVVQTPMDPSMPPFTFTADNIRDQFQIVDGTRAETEIQDDPKSRELIANSAAAFAAMLREELQRIETSKSWGETIGEEKKSPANRSTFFS